MKRSGTADLPLHGGRVPYWLASRMQRLGTGIVEGVLPQHGRSGVLTRLSDPFWFQALGSAVLLAFSGGERLHREPHAAIVGEHAGTITNLVECMVDSYRGRSEGTARKRAPRLKLVTIEIVDTLH